MVLDAAITILIVAAISFGLFFFYAAVEEIITLVAADVATTAVVN